MKGIKIVIISLIVLLIISIILLIFINNRSPVSSDGNELDANSGPQDNVIELNAYTEKETDDNKIFAINEYINQMLSYENNEDSEAVGQIVSNPQENRSIRLKAKTICILCARNI